MNLLRLLPYLLSGGFLAGYRTYIFGFLMVLNVVAQYLVGDIGLMDLTGRLPELLAGAGLMSLRAAISGKTEGG